MIDALTAEFAFLKQFGKENGLRGYLDYRVRKFRGLERPVTIFDNGQALRIRPTGPDLSVARMARQEFSALAHLYRRDQRGVIIDAGGFIGSAALELSRLYPNARVLSIEPSSQNVALLRENTAGHPQIEVIHAALTTDEAPATVALQDRETGPWGFSVATTDAAELEQVPTLAISTLMEQVGEEDLLIVKMDIEGAEAGLLTPQAAWLDRTGVLMIELHERIVAGCEEAFFAANAGRCIVPSGGEKFLSIGARYFAARAQDRAA